MQNNILFFQSTSLGAKPGKSGLFELLLTHLENDQSPLFEEQQIIVPNLAMALWLKDKIAVKYGICANLDCVVLPNPVLEKIYYVNNPEHRSFNFAQAKYIIYDYLSHNKLADADELNSYICTNGILDKLKTYQLASQLHQIFHEYLYLRTEDLLNLDKSAIKSWQKKILHHLFVEIGEGKTFLDIYKYFMTVNLDLIKLPAKLMIFGLTSIYPSQLHILCRLSNITTIYWYYQSPSYKYYGDLLSDKAKSKLEQKLLRKPNLKPDDLYLQDGNPLLANLAQQSREFTELLIANDIDMYMFDQQNSSNANTILEQIQEDIRNIKYRIKPDYRFGSNPDIYADPIDLSDKMNGGVVYDLPKNQNSIKINICHNRMREVQVMFNEIVAILNNNPRITLSDILITAPDIDDYAPYIAAVFDNETIGSEKLLYNITGNRKYKNYKILETLKILLNAPYVLTVNYFIEILIQSEIQENFDISMSDVELVKKWLYDNNTHFGYDERDFNLLGYTHYQIHSFRQFLNNLVLGACISDNVWQDHIPLYVTYDKGGADAGNLGNNLTESNNYQGSIPYDNIDSNQINLCNKLIILINLLEWLRDKFYSAANAYKDLTINEIHAILDRLNEECIKDKNSVNNFERFLGGLLEVQGDLVINLPILNSMLNEYIEDFSSSFMFSGNITCASMRYMRNIPYQMIYVLGLNFGEYPSSYTPNNLSLLAHDWAIADRNYNIEDKQTFLDIILACEKQLYLSYIGRRETDNSKIKPSPLLGLLINTLGQSFSNFTLSLENENTKLTGEIKYDFKNLLIQQSLHPFYNNRQSNYSNLWFQLGRAQTDFTDQAWDFTKLSPLAVDLSQFYHPTINDIVKVFLYTNTNLYKVLGINHFNHELELSDTENINLTDRSLAIQLEKYFTKYLTTIDVSDMDNTIPRTGSVTLTMDQVTPMIDPVIPTVAPVIPMAAPVIPTVAPVIPAVPPVIPTIAPVIPTIAPVIPAQAGIHKNTNTIEQLREFLITSGVLGYAHIGQTQFNYYYALYIKYTALRGKAKAKINLSYEVTPEIVLIINDEIYVENSTVIVTDSFANIVNDILASNIEDLPYALKIRGIITYLLCFAAGNVCVGDDILSAERVIIRQITTQGENRDFTIQVQDAASVLNKVLRYYVRSLSNPVLIHKGAIKEYAKLIKMNKPHNLCADGARAKYIADFENYDLDKIRQDRIFSSVAENYFEFMYSIGGVNDIFKIGEILSACKDYNV